MYKSHNRKYDIDHDPINRSRWEKDDTSKSQGHDAGVTKMKADFDAGAKTLRQLILAQQVAQWQEELNSLGDVDDDTKAELQEKIAATKHELNKSTEGRSFITEGLDLLQQRARALREKLGSDAWSLRFYDKPVSPKILKELGIVPTMGKVIGRGQTGKDITR